MKIVSDKLNTQRKSIYWPTEPQSANISPNSATVRARKAKPGEHAQYTLERRGRWKSNSRKPGVFVFQRKRNNLQRREYQKRPASLHGHRP